MDGEVIIPVNLDTKSFENQIAEVEEKLNDLVKSYESEKAMSPFEGQEEDLKQLGLEIEKTKNKLIKLREQQKKLNEPETLNLSAMFSKMGSSIDGIISKVAKWGLAIFSIRSAYSLVRQSISTISQYNKTIASDIENIRFGLASSLEPVIQRIVQWAYKLMQAINFVWRILTGHNLFSNMKKSIDDTNRAVKGTNKSAKELRKTLSGFDEMNILNDNVTGSGGVGGAGGIADTISKMDLEGTGLLSEGLQNKLKSIANILQKIAGFFNGREGLLYGGIAGLLGLKIGQKVGNLITLLGGNGAKSGLIGALLTLDAVLVTKIVKDVKDKLIPLIKETNERMDDTINMSKGVTLQQSKYHRAIIENATAQNENTEATKKNIEHLIKQIKQNELLNEQYSDQISLAGFITGQNKEIVQLRKENNIQTANMIDTLLQLYDLEKLDENQKKQLANILQEEIKKVEKANLGYREGTEEYKKNAERVDQLKKSLEKLPKTETTTWNLNVNDKNARKTLANFLGDVGSAGIQGALGIKGNINSAINKIKYAKGGIVNLPSKGVPVGIAGERGQEGIVPLTDSQQMTLLGEAIGRYITINATIENTMNGRVISRELQKIQQENSFASNR